VFSLRLEVNVHVQRYFERRGLYGRSCMCLSVCLSVFVCVCLSLSLCRHPVPVMQSDNRWTGVREMWYGRCAIGACPMMVLFN
jgi:hypothetical protein